MNPGLRNILVWIRSLHIYLSLAAFLLLFFFTLTGWLMVHQEGLGLNQEMTREEHVPLKNSNLKLNSEEGKQVLAGLELYGRMTECEEDYAQFAEPGAATWVELDRVNGEIRMTHETRGLSGRGFDLHRNRHSTWFGTLIQDLTAALFLMVSLSGILLWLPLSRRRRLGLILLMLGAVVVLLWMW